MSSLKREQLFWNDEAPYWRNHSGLFGELKEPIFRFITRGLTPLLNKLPSSPLVANLGAGANNQAYLGKSLDCHTLALDLSPRMLSLNPARLRTVADLNRPLPLAADSADLVVSFFLARYLGYEQAGILLTEILRVLRPGTSFFIADIKSNNFDYQKSQFNAAVWSKLADKIGFHRVNLVTQDFKYSDGNAEMGLVTGQKPIATSPADLRVPERG